MFEFVYLDDCCFCLDCTQGYMELWEKGNTEVEMDGMSEIDMSWYADICAM
jgi:hypothetical protein